MRFHFPLAAAKNYFLGLTTSGSILFATLFYFNSQKPGQNFSQTQDLQYISAERLPAEKFNPNELDAEGWKNLGFSERQAATILKYRNMLGGSFSTKEQIQNCYVISAEKFAELEPLLLLSGSSKNAVNQFRTTSYRSAFKPFAKNSFLKIPGKFNPDLFSENDFVKMGFSERQAASIVKYRNFLGGSFQSKQKLKDCFVISEERFRQMEPYLLLPEISQESHVPQRMVSSTSPSQKFDPNTLQVTDWQKLGFSEKQAQVIVNYRDRNLKGRFSSLEDIQKCFVISPAKFEELRPFIVLNPSQSNGAGQQTAAPPQAKTDFSAVDLNQITYKQLVEYGFDSKSAGMMLGFRKKLGGFVSKQQILDTYDIDKGLAQKLVNEAQLDVSSVQKYTLLDAPEEWLKTHPYFKYSADKIIYYRTSFDNEKRIWNMMKVKPEYEARMKLYLK